MIELFSRRAEAINLPEDAVLTPLPVDDDISSLSAILLDDDYYQLVRSGTAVVDGINLLDAAYLIPFKAKAWLDLTQKKASGQAVDSKNIRKHKNDVFRLSALFGPQSQVKLSKSVLADLHAFLDAMQNEDVDIKQLGITREKTTVIADLMKIYSLG